MPRNSESLRAWKRANPDKLRQYQRDWRKRHPEKARALDCKRKGKEKELAKRRAQYHQNKHRLKDNRRDSSFRAMYGISLKERDAMIAERNGKCDICNEICDIPCIDHIHGTKPPIIRGILCSGCNLGIGRLGEDIDRLLSAVHYLIKRGETKWNKALLNSQSKTNSQ